MYHEEMEDWMENARIEDMRLKVKVENKMYKLQFNVRSYISK
jgi:hypothetical protein